MNLLLAMLPEEFQLLHPYLHYNRALFEYQDHGYTHSLLSDIHVHDLVPPQRLPMDEGHVAFDLLTDD